MIRELITYFSRVNESHDIWKMIGSKAQTQTEKSKELPMLETEMDIGNLFQKLLHILTWGLVFFLLSQVVQSVLFFRIFRNLIVI